MTHRHRRLVLLSTLLAGLTAGLGAQNAPPPRPAPDEKPPQFDSASLAALQWRNIGPFRGGRVVAVAGVPQQPRTFYFGGVGGGVWKTTDGGGTVGEHHRRPASAPRRSARSPSRPRTRT